MTLDWLALSGGGFATAVCVHAVVCRLPTRGDRVSRFLAVGIAAGALLAWFAIGCYGALAPETAATLLVYAFACELYIFLFTMTISSVSSNLVVRLSRGEMRLAEILRDYDSASMVAQRLDRLIGTGFLERSGNGVTLTTKGRRFILVFRRLRRFFGHG